MPGPKSPQPLSYARVSGTVLAQHGFVKVTKRSEPNRSKCYAY